MKRAWPLPLLIAFAVSCGSGPSPAVGRARADLDALARTIGHRPVATPANRLARDYLTGALERAGFGVRIQDAEAVRPERGDTVRVANLIAERPGSVADAIALLSHYDSSPFAPGASDAALGVAVVLESARQLALGPPMRHSLLVLVTDGEEAGLMGAVALVNDEAVSARLKACLNFDALGPSGPSMLFEAGDGTLVDAWRRASPSPRGTSYALEIYKRLPNDTDFTVLNARGIPGLNFATVGGSAVYHTARDTADRINSETLEQAITNTVAIVRELDRMNLARAPGGARVFFDVPGSVAISYGMTAAWGMTIAALLLAGVAWVRLIAGARERAELRITGVTAAWTLIGTALVASVMLAMVWALRAARGTYHPWYAHPGRLLVLLALAGFVSVWALMRSAERLPASLRGSSDPRAVWLVALPVWMAMAVAIQAAAPGAAYLWSLPLLTAGLSLAALPLRWPFLLRLVSAGILIVAALFWVRDAWVLHHFLVEQMARLPIRPPASIYVVVPMGAGLMLAPPLIAACGGAWFAGARRRGMQVIIFALAAAAIGVALAPSYTFDRPQRRSVRYLSDELSGTAAWEVGGLEAALDLDESVADVPRGWARADAPLGSSLPLAAMRRPFVYRAPGLRLPFPGDVHVRAAPIGEAVAVELTVVAPEDSEVTFAIPSAVAVGQPTLSGVVRRGYWVASYVGPPVGGVTIGFRLALGDLDRLGASAVVLSRPRVGGGLRPGQLPRWLPQDRAVWTASEVFVRPVADAIRAAAGAAAVARASLR